MAFKLAAFDWDGTLVDSRQLGYHCSCIMFSRHNLVAPPFEKYIEAVDYMEFYYRHGIPRSVRREELNAIWDEGFRDRSELIDLRPMARELLAACRSRSMRTAILSGNTENTVGHGISLFGLSPLVDRWKAAAHNKVSGLLEMAAHFRVRTEEVFYLDDTREGLLAAKKAGATAIGILGGFQSEERIREARPHHCVASLEEVIALLGPAK